METLAPSAWLPAVIAGSGLVAGLLADAAERRAAAVWLAALGSFAAFAAALWIVAVDKVPVVVTGPMLAGGGFTSLAGVLYGLAGASIMAGSARLSASDRGPATAALIVLGAVFGHALLAALDLVTLVVALAGLAVVAYALVAGAGTPRAEEASIRYFVQGAVASGLTIYGVAVVFGLAGGSSGYLAGAVALVSAESTPALLGLGLVLSVFAFKLGAFPFHSWVPDVYETADPASAAFLASGPKLAGLIALLVIVRGTLFEAPVFAPATGVLVTIAVGSLAFGAFGMVRQRSVARILGYSGIAQVGYGLVGIASGDVGVRATVVFAVTYAVGVAAAFCALEAVSHADPAWDGSVEGLAGLSRRSPLIAFALAVSMLSLTGIPLFAGFWGKLYVLLGAIDAGMVWLAVVAGVAALVSFGAYGLVLRWAYFESADLDDDAQHTRGGAAMVTAVALALLVIGLGSIPLVTGVGPVYAFFALG